MPNDGLNRTRNHAGTLGGAVWKLIGRVVSRRLGLLLGCTEYTIHTKKRRLQMLVSLNSTISRFLPCIIRGRV